MSFAIDLNRDIARDLIQSGRSLGVYLNTIEFDTIKSAASLRQSEELVQLVNRITSRSIVMINLENIFSNPQSLVNPKELSPIRAID
jgi:cell division protein ZapA (FtsZ GTPase activity inhibitor)